MTSAESFLRGSPDVLEQRVEADDAADFRQRTERRRVRKLLPRAASEMFVASTVLIL